jgi:hypothetical protein
VVDDKDAEDESTDERAEESSARAGGLAHKVAGGGIYGVGVVDGGAASVATAADEVADAEGTGVDEVEGEVDVEAVNEGAVSHVASAGEELESAAEARGSTMSSAIKSR